MRVVPICLAIAAVVVGCSNPEAPATPPTPDARAPAASDRYLPLSVGAKWTYHATDPASGATGETQSVITALEDVGGAKAGTTAFRVDSSTLIGSVVNWQQDLGTSIVRHREQFFDLKGVKLSDYVFTPYRLRLDESPAHTTKGATWTETHTATVDNLVTGTKVNASFSVAWTVEAVDDPVTVPAGTFSCLRIHRVQTGYAPSDETHWFARHVGKVKETGPEQKELTSYSIPQ